MRTRIGVFVLVLFGLAVLPAMGNTLTVTSTGDSGSGSLRDAVAAASSGDTIDFNLSYPVTITLSSPIVISTSLTVSGPGASNLTLSGNNATRVFFISSGVTANISGVAIENGKSIFGGGIFNSGGALTIADSTFSGNSASFYGGAIYNSAGTAVIKSSTLAGNSATYYGGAVYNLGGTFMLINSTVWGNSTSVDGGAIFNYNQGILTLVNGTLALNASSSGGGIYNNNATLVLKSTLVANSSGGNCSSTGGVATSDGYNLSDDASCSHFLSSTTDQNNIGAGLNPNGLQDNGGATKTDALLSNSPAVDAIPVADCTVSDEVTPNTVDQRGTARPQGPACDIGAFELVETSMFSSLVGKLETAPQRFDLNSTFTLGVGSNGINPLDEPVRLQLGTYYNVTIPTGSFHRLKNGAKQGSYVFSGVIDGASVSVQIVPLAGNRYQFKAEGSPVNLTGFSNPVNVTLTIGDDTGTTSVYADF